MKCIETQYKIELTKYEVLILINAVQNYKDYKIELKEDTEDVEKLINDLLKFY